MRGSLFSLFFAFVVGIFATPPQLVDQKIWFANQTILNVDYELAVVQMEFDQELFLAGETHLCGKAEDPCPDANCVPCDWSGQEPTDCSDVQCCGPAQIGGEPWDQVNDWCESSTYPYHSLQLNEKSAVFTVEPEEIVYFRFFISEENFCQPFKLSVRPYYGVPNVILSNKYAFPTVDNAEWRKGKFPPNFGWAQNGLVVCPSAHSDYQMGTYSLGVMSYYSASFDVEIVIAQQDYPLVPPPGRILCGDVPPSELTDAQAGTDQPVFCLQDTESMEMNYAEDFVGQYIQLVLPIPSGCHQISLSLTGLEINVDPDIFCMPKDTSSPVSLDNSILTRWTFGSDRVTFPICTNDVSYVRCGLRFWFTGPASIIFSTMAQPIVTPLAPDINTPSASLSYQEGLTAMASVRFGQVDWIPCADFFFGCTDWIVPPISDPLVLWPPAAQLPRFDVDKNIYAEYYNATKAQPLKNTMIGVIALVAGSTVVYPRDRLDEISVALLFITNEFGEVPILPNNASDLYPKTQSSPSQYLPTISFPSFSEVDLSTQCNQTSYDQLHSYVDVQLAEIFDSDSLKTIEFHKYVVDILDAGIAGSSCIEAATKAMNTQVENVTFLDQTFCRYQPGTLEWDEDPCCNPDLRAIQCCIPFTFVQDADQFTSANSSTCGVPECADTYFEDLAQSFNHVKDLIQGCSSGVKDIQRELNSIIDKQLNYVIRDCLNQVGFGDDFKGTVCVADFQCEQWSGRCNLQTNRCVLGTTPEVEDAFLRCYISKTSSSLEEYLRLNVLPPEVASAPRDSEEFFLGLKSAASVEDCIAVDDALDISLRSQYVWSSIIACKADVLGLPVDDIEGINALCPDGTCLGSFCKQSSAQCFYSCEPAYSLVLASEEECTASSTVCPVTGLPGDCDESRCMYCPGGEGEECIFVPGSQDFCENTVACELQDGRIVFDLTEGECNALTGSCSVDCNGESCRSLDQQYGVCLATVGSEDLCDNINNIDGIDAVWYDGTICVVDVETEATCTELSSIISAPTNWETCESVPIGSCNGDDAFQRYLKCFVSPWRLCENQEECENSGHCSDREWTTIIRSEEHPIDVQFGACFSSGFYVPNLRDPECYTSMDRPGNGCREREITEQSGCLEFEVIGFEWWWRTWLLPATSESECRNKNDARYGCQQPGPETNLIWLGDEECACRGGYNGYVWEWTPGIWSSGISRNLQWQEIEPVQKYQWTPALSFELLQTWLEANEEQRFSYIVKSEVICENSYVTSSLNTLVCDCLSNSDIGGSNCYIQRTTDQVEELMGLTGACVDEESFVKSPSSRVSFALDSLTAGCTLTNLSIVSEAWFVVPPPRPSILFEFEDKPQRGIVLNQKSGSTVGILRGDGSVLSFTTLTNVKSFQACLLVSENTTNHKLSTKYPIPDFGYSETPTGTIYPLGLQNINISITFDSEFWCSIITLADIPMDGNVIRLYPISRVEHYENKEDDYTSRKTRALMYTLGVCYCICFFCLLFYLFTFLRSARKSEMLGIISAILAVLCIFRAVFMFGYPNALFENNELAEFVVFEIPTFLLFSVVIVSIFFWKRLVVRKGFFTANSNTLRVVIGLGLAGVWSLWVIVTIVYSEVILGDEAESPCPGRVSPSYDEQEEDTRTLTIVYQSLIISVTFVLASIFCYYSYMLHQQTKKVSRSKRFVMVIGGVIVLSFFLRSILFIIVLAAEFKSSVYMFITLMITEVLVIFFLQLQFNSSYFRSMVGGGSTVDTSTTGSGTRHSQGTMDD